MSVPSTSVPTASVPIRYHWQPPARPEAEAGPSTRRPLDQMDVDSDKGEQSVRKSTKRKRGGDDQPIKARGPVVGSGLYHSPACLRCVKGGFQCEKQLKSGWACVRCGTMKVGCSRGPSASKQHNREPAPAPSPSPSPSPSPPPTKRKRHVRYTSSNDGNNLDQIKDSAPIPRPAPTSSSSSLEPIRKPALAPTKATVGKGKR